MSGMSRAELSVHLRDAVARGSSERAIALLSESRGVDLNEKDLAGMTLLHLASMQGHPLVVQALLDGGAEAGAKNNRDETPLDSALAYGYDEIAGIFGKHALQADRTAWMKATAAAAIEAAESVGEAGYTPLLRCMLNDGIRMTIPPSAVGDESRQVVSEYAGMVASFL